MLLADGAAAADETFTRFELGSIGAVACAARFEPAASPFSLLGSMQGQWSRMSACGRKAAAGEEAGSAAVEGTHSVHTREMNVFARALYMRWRVAMCVSDSGAGRLLLLLHWASSDAEAATAAVLCHPLLSPRPCPTHTASMKACLVHSLTAHDTDSTAAACSLLASTAAEMQLRHTKANARMRI